MVTPPVRRLKTFLGAEVRPYFRARGKKPIRQQLAEMSSLYRLYRFLPYQYVKHGLYLRDFSGNFRDYIPPILLQRYCDKINPSSRAGTVVDKQKFARIMRQRGLPVVDEIFTIHSDGRIIDLKGKPITFGEAVKAIERQQVNELFVKPTHGSRGLGAMRLSVRSGEIFRGEELIDGDGFYRLLFSGRSFKSYIVQPLVQQHNLLSKMNPTSVNTLRIDTLKQEREVVVNSAVLRVGSGMTSMDNFATGGFIVKIDLKTGRLGRFATTKVAYGGKKVEVHPKSGFRFSNTALPFWKDAIDCVLEGAICLQPLRALGWDVAITENGPLLLETNHNYDIFLQQEGVGGLRNTALGRAFLEELF